jgi:hypothetical protein
MARRKEEKPEAQQLAIPLQTEKVPEAQPEELRLIPFALRPGDPRDACGRPRVGNGGGPRVHHAVASNPSRAAK